MGGGGDNTHTLLWPRLSSRVFSITMTQVTTTMVITLLLLLLLLRVKLVYFIVENESSTILRTVGNHSLRRRGVTFQKTGLKKLHTLRAARDIISGTFNNRAKVYTKETYQKVTGTKVVDI